MADERPQRRKPGERPRRADGSERRRPDRGGRERDPRSDRGPRRAYNPEPELPEHIEAGQLDRQARRELLTLSKENAEGVARHLVAAGQALQEGELDQALAHAQHASRRAGRVAMVREALGLVYYRRGDWAEALREFRTARRLSGSHHLLPHMADVERGLGRPNRAIELAQDPGAKSLAAADRVELAIVVSGARRDLGQEAAAVQLLRELVQASPASRSWAGRLYYAYADALLATGKEGPARDWFARALDADRDGQTDAGDRLAELDGVQIDDLSADDDTDPNSLDEAEDRESDEAEDAEDAQSGAAEDSASPADDARGGRP